MPLEPPFVLLIDDNEDNRALYTHILGTFGIRVVEAASAQEGLSRAADLHPALILLDLSMPDVDGWEVARRLRGTAATAAIPIVALSAHTTGDARQRAIRAGCNDYLPKPTLPADLLEVTRRFLGHAP
jgi:two-component system, cell cycle response regulator DivK